MMYHAKEGSIAIGNTEMPYIEFGAGVKPLIILPGLADGLKSVRGQAMALAFLYRQFAKKYKVYFFSRKDDIEEGYSLKDMAVDQKIALEQLGITKCCMMGVSQGGMIAQHFAIDYPDMVEKLILAVSASRVNDTMRRGLNTWMEYAKNNDYASLMIDTLNKSYSPKKSRTYRLLYPLISRVGKPQSFARFLTQADACLKHNTYHELHRIACPTLIVGGDSDQVVGPGASPEMAQIIAGSRLLIYPGLGHAAYEEGKDFNQQVLDFLLNG